VQVQSAGVLWLMLMLSVSQTVKAISLDIPRWESKHCCCKAAITTTNNVSAMSDRNDVPRGWRFV
jgi:hypothetical protein